MTNKPGPKPRGNVRIDVFVTPYQKTWLEKEAKRRGISLAGMTRIVLDHFIDEEGRQ